MPELDPQHLTWLTKALTTGRLVPFLGAGVNLCDRPPEAAFVAGSTEYPPSGGELAAHLVDQFGYPESAAVELARVSQFVAVTTGTGPLYDELRSVFDVDYPPTSLHRLLADLPHQLEAKGFPRTSDPLRRQLTIVTTNYDDLMERAFADRGQPVHVVSYVADGEAKGRFVHRPPGGQPKVIERPNQYNGLMGVEEPVLLKIHGAIDRLDAGADSYVVTEDHYIDYLSLSDLSTLLPVPLTTKLTNSHLLFLGYGLRDWNLRVILHRLWGDRKLSWKSWAIQLEPDELDREFWRGRDVDILDLPLDRYTAAVAARLAALEPAA